MESQKQELKGGVNRFGHRFTIEQKREVVSLVEAGFSCKEVMSEYQISDVTLNKWRKRFGSFPVRTQKTYTPSQKRSVVRAVEGGLSVNEASIAFGINQTSVRKWVIESKAENAELGAFEMKNPPQETSEDQELKVLKQQLAEAQLKINALETMIDVAEEHLKIDIRKKSGARQSPK